MWNINWKQKIIPAISNMKDFERFLESKFEYCIFMNFHISLLVTITDMARKRGKKVLVHMDLIKGLTPDEYGCEFVCQKLHVDGVISTKGKVVEAAKKNHKIGILRLFLIDTQSMEKGIGLCNIVKPDFMEVLPGIASSIFPYIQSRTNVPIMGGGLIKTREQIEACFESGVCAVTISDVKSALEYYEEKDNY